MKFYCLLFLTRHPFALLLLLGEAFLNISLIMSSGPAHRVQSAVVEYGFPQGHLGHLTTEEEAALNNFKVVCAEKGLYKPGNGSDEPASHEDATLLYVSVQDSFLGAY